MTFILLRDLTHLHSSARKIQFDRLGQRVLNYFGKVRPDITLSRRRDRRNRQTAS